MNENVGIFKPMFILESLLGISTVSLKTLKQSNWKRLYAIFWVVVYIVEIIQYLIIIYKGEETYPNIYILLHCSAYAGTLYILILSMFDHKTQIAAALNLQSSQDRIDAENIQRVNINQAYSLALDFAVFLVVITVNIVNTWVSAVGNVFITIYLTSFHYIAAHHITVIVYVNMMIKSVYIKDTLTAAIENCSDMTQGSRRVNASQPQEEELNAQMTIINLVKEVRGTVSNLQDDLNAYFWPYMLWFVLHWSFLAARGVYLLFTMRLQEFTFFSVMALVIIAFLYFLSFIRISEINAGRYHATSAKMSKICQTTDNGGHRKNIKHEMLACLHRSTPTTCHIIDLEYSLIQTVLDTAILIFTSWFSI